MTFIPSEILADIFQYLPAKEVHLNMELVCNKWFEIIERNASFLPKKVIPGEFEVHFYGVIRHYCKDPSTKNYTAPNSENFHSFWHSKYILQNLNLSNYAWKFDTLKKAFDTYGKPMLVENLAIRTGNSEAKNFYQDYMHMSKYLQPVSVKWFNTERLADLKFLRSSGFFQMKSIKTLEVIVQLPKRRPFSEMSLTEFVDFIGNADNNKKCLKKSMTLSWNFNGELLFAEQLVQKFLSTTEPEQFFREFYSSYEGQNARNMWFEYFMNNGTLCTMYRDDERFINKNRITYEISRKDGWKIGLDCQIDGNTAFYVNHASEVHGI